MRDDSETLGEMAEESPEDVMFAVSMMLDEMPDDFGKEDLVELAASIAIEEDLNLFRLLKEHPEAAEDIFDVDPRGLSEEFIAEFDLDE